MANELMDLVAATQIRTDIPDFKPGDTVDVHVRVVEGNKERIQRFQGVVIARGGSGAAKTFTVRKLSNGVGVERVFPLYSPKIAQIDLVREGRVRRAKLYYLRGLRGKAARIQEKMRDQQSSQKAGSKGRAGSTSRAGSVGEARQAKKTGSGGQKKG